MENLSSHVPAGMFFGAGNPNNWGYKDKLEGIVGAAGNPTTKKVAAECFSLHAKLHAKFWKCAETEESVLSLDWLQGSQWLKGK